MTNLLTFYWKEAQQLPEASSIELQYISTPSGLVTLYPGLFGVVPAWLRGYTRPWYRRALANPFLNTFSTPYDDAFDNGKVMTFSKAVYADATENDLSSLQLAAVVGLDFEFPVFYNQVINNSQLNCAYDKNDASKPQCFMIDNSGLFIITSDFLGPSFVTTPVLGTASDSVFLGEVEAELADQLITLGFLRLTEVLNYQDEEFQFAYTVNASTLAMFGDNDVLSGQLSFHDDYCTEGTYFVAEVKNTNTFLIVIENYSFRQSSNCRVTSIPPSYPLLTDACDLNGLLQNISSPNVDCVNFQVNEDILQSVFRGSDADCDRPTSMETVWVEWSDVSAIAISTLTSMMMVVVIIIDIILFKKRLSSVVRCSSPLFLNLNLLGMLFGYSSIFLFIGEPNIVVCNLRLWLLVIAFVLMFGTLLMKTYRIWKLFGNQYFVQKSITNGNMMLYLTGLLCFPLVLSFLTLFFSVYSLYHCRSC